MPMPFEPPKSIEEKPEYPTQPFKTEEIDDAADIEDDELDEDIQENADIATSPPQLINHPAIQPIPAPSQFEIRQPLPKEDELEEQVILEEKKKCKKILKKSPKLANKIKFKKIDLQNRVISASIKAKDISRNLSEKYKVT